MKNLKQSIWVLLVALPLLLTSSCFRIVSSSDDEWMPPCERFETGTVCFYNATNGDIKVTIDDTKTEVEERTTICVDIYEGHYDYKGKRNFKKWEGSIFVDRCSETRIVFD